jgi:HK97 family phage prohead protease
MSESKLVCAFQFKELGDAGQFAGHAAVFDNVDLQGDKIAAGAFAKTLKETGGKWPILMGHIMARIVGFSLEAAEDSKGLAVTGEFTLGSDEGRNAYATAQHAARVKAPMGLSIGYGVRKGGADYDEATGVRTLKSLDVYEFSLAAVPANPRARVARVKAAGERWSVRECEEILRDAGFSSSEAKCLISSLKGQRDVEPETALAAPDLRAVELVNAARSTNLLVQVRDLLHV